jgi:hypothetical protein
MKTKISLEEFNRIIERTLKEFQTNEKEFAKLITENYFIEIISQIYKYKNMIKDVQYTKKYRPLLYVFQNYDLTNYSYNNYIKFAHRKENSNCKENRTTYPKIVLDVMSDIFLDNNKEENKFWKLYFNLFFYPITLQRYEELLQNTEIWITSKKIYNRVITNVDDLDQAFKFIELNHIFKFTFTSLLADRIRSKYLNYSYLEIFEKIEFFSYLSRLPLFAINKEIIEDLIDKSYEGKEFSCFMSEIDGIKNKLINEINILINQKYNFALDRQKSFHFELELDYNLKRYITKRIGSSISDIQNLKEPMCKVYNFYFWQFLRNEYKINPFMKKKLIYLSADNGELVKINEELEQKIDRSFWNDDLVDYDNKLIDEFIKIFKGCSTLEKYRVNNNFFIDRRNDVPFKEYKAFFPLFNIEEKRIKEYRVEYDYHESCDESIFDVFFRTSAPYPKKILSNIVE